MSCKIVKHKEICPDCITLIGNIVTLCGASMLYQMQRFPRFCATTTSLMGTHCENKLNKMCNKLGSVVRYFSLPCTHTDTRKSLTSCSKSANKLSTSCQQVVNKLSTSCLPTACPQLSTSLEQTVNNL